MPDYQANDGVITVSFSGSLDTVTCIDFENELYDKVKEKPNVIIFDLKAVSNISSMFLRVCTKVVKETGKEKLTIVNANETVMKVFKLTKLDSFLTINPE